MIVADAVNSLPILQRLATDLANAPIVASVSHNLIDVIRQCNEISVKFRDDQQEIVKKLGELDEETEQYSIDESSQEVFKQEVLGLLNEDISITYTPVNVYLIDPYSTLNINEINQLMWLFKEE